MLSVFCTTRTAQAAKCRFGGLFDLSRLTHLLRYQVIILDYSILLFFGMWHSGLSMVFIIDYVQHVALCNPSAEIQNEILEFNNAFNSIHGDRNRVHDAGRKVQRFPCYPRATFKRPGPAGSVNSV